MLSNFFFIFTQCRVMNEITIVTKLVNKLICIRKTNSSIDYVLLVTFVSNHWCSYFVSKPHNLWNKKKFSNDQYRVIKSVSLDNEY